jgi:monoamine oxidase
VNGGYTALIQALAAECTGRGGRIYHSHVVKEVKWSQGKVQVRTANKETFTASQIVVTVPLGVLGDEDGEGSISFKPVLEEQMKAAKNMGFGDVIKVVLQLREDFRKSAAVKKHLGKNLNKLGFLLTDAPIPTWWTQYPDKSNLLTGWLAGPTAANLRHADNEVLLQMAIDSLSYIFQMTHNEVMSEIVNSHVMNWTKEPFTRGAYAYKTIHTTSAVKVLAAPIEDTIFFAGEALYEGSEMGTVEAALKNALEVAGKVITGR